MTVIDTRNPTAALVSSSGEARAPAPLDDVLQTIGNTPMVELRNLDTGPCRLFAKLENQNPGGSIKDRIALGMIRGAEADGKIAPGGTLVEATSGNTGVGLALVGGMKGYRVVIVIPDKMSQEKIFHLRALGAEVIVTRSDVAPGHPEHYQEMARRIAEETDNALYVHQHGNDDNPRTHEECTGPEILAQMGNDLDAVVCGIGTGGTLTGMARFMRRAAPGVEMVLADPEGSILVEYLDTGRLAEAGSWIVEGIGEDVLPPIGDLSLVDHAYTISDADSLDAARELLRKEGIMGGSSTGTLLAAALRYCRAQDRPKRVVTFVPDSGLKYLSKMYNDYWMTDQGFVERETFGDLRDLIARRHTERATVIAHPDDTLLVAYGRMKLYDVSQLPVLGEDGGVAGIIDESDILMTVFRDEERFADTVASAMTSRLETIDAERPLEDLMPIFEHDRVAIVVREDRFAGLITRIDLLNHLRRRLKQ
jgi:cystathionine beta-synthase